MTELAQFEVGDLADTFGNLFNVFRLGLDVFRDPSSWRKREGTTVNSGPFSGDICIVAGPSRSYFEPWIQHKKRRLRLAFSSRMTLSPLPIVRKTGVAFADNRVLLADDSTSVRMAIKHLLKRQPGITFIGEAANFQEALAMCAELKPNVILPDLHMARELAAQYVKTKLPDCAEYVLAMCAWNDDRSQALANLYGAEMLFDKAPLTWKLVPAIVVTAT